MLKRVFTIVFCGLLFKTMMAADAWAIQPDQALSAHAALVKGSVQRIGAGTNSLIAVRLRDKSVVSGWVSGVNEDSFQLTDVHTNTISTVRFAEATRLAGANLVSGDTVKYGRDSRQVEQGAELHRARQAGDVEQLREDDIADYRNRARNSYRRCSCENALAGH
jgi:hypothetical protein